MGVSSYPGGKDVWPHLPVQQTANELKIGQWQVMQRWETPLMERLAEFVTHNRGDVLEVGFGLGISADAILRKGCRSYTVIEAHPMIAEKAREWGSNASVAVTVHEGFWQDIVPTLAKRFDGILFDTYPLTEDEWLSNHFPFIPIAPSLLTEGGVLTYFSDETVDFRAEHLRLLLAAFKDIRLVRIDGLEPYPGCEYWTADHMIVPIARHVL